MPLAVQVLFGNPQSELAGLLRARIGSCSSLSVVVGFATPEGLQAIAPPVLAQPSKLATMVLGAGTHRGFGTLDQLVSNGVAPDRLFVHLGHTRPLGKNGIHWYHPMLHSKIYYCEMPGGNACAFIGSHNLTGFALLGLNGEASVMIEGAADDPEFQKIRSHITEARRQAVQYDPSMKDALTWWASEFMYGMQRKVNDEPDDVEAKRTIVIVTAQSGGDLPRSREVIYFEVPEAIPLTSLTNEVHLYVFETLPPSPIAALAALDGAKRSFWCKVLGLEEQGGGTELKSNWQIVDRRAPALQRTPNPFRPTVSPNMRQVRAQVYKDVRSRFEYLFGRGKIDWKPIFSSSESVAPSEEGSRLLNSVELRVREDGDWQLVRGLEPADPHFRTQKYREAMHESSPESGSYVLISTRRRVRDPDQPKEHRETLEKKR